MTDEVESVVYTSSGLAATFPSRGRQITEVKTQMNQNRNQKLSENSRRLRREMTREERHLWYDCLKQLPVTVHRQKIFGNYIVDFYIAAIKLVIEIDGSQHYEEEGIRADQARDLYLKKQGLEIVRYSNWEINNCFRSVCEDIWKRIEGI